MNLLTDCLQDGVVESHLLGEITSNSSHPNRLRATNDAQAFILFSIRARWSIIVGIEINHQLQLSRSLLRTPSAGEQRASILKTLLDLPSNLVAIPKPNWAQCLERSLNGSSLPDSLNQATLLSTVTNSNLLEGRCKSVK